MDVALLSGNKTHKLSFLDKHFVFKIRDTNNRRFDLSEVIFKIETVYMKKERY